LSSIKQKHMSSRHAPNAVLLRSKTKYNLADSPDCRGAKAQSAGVAL
jgi:hypothetical protein